MGRMVMLLIGCLLAGCACKSVPVAPPVAPDLPPIHVQACRMTFYPEPRGAGFAVTMWCVCRVDAAAPLGAAPLVRFGISQ